MRKKCGYTQLHSRNAWFVKNTDLCESRHTHTHPHKNSARTPHLIYSFVIRFFFLSPFASIIFLCRIPFAYFTFERACVYPESVRFKGEMIWSILYECTRIQQSSNERLFVDSFERFGSGFLFTRTLCIHSFHSFTRSHFL